MKKKEIRSYFLNARKNISSQKLEEISMDAAECFFNSFDLKSVKCVHVFLPIPLKAEINTKYIIDRFWKSYPDIDITIPKSDMNNLSIDSYYFTPATVLEENPWKIPEPITAQQTPHELIDLVFLPMLAFDDRGYRVGYGKGFYDRFLATCRSDVLKIGLSSFPSTDHIEDVDQYDIPMNYCIVGKELYRF
ncbi:MAG: 5-formyltetrahydrofolate cyclo-ligase [Sporocytophaga sp.]|nr:5-formyltetrahydrofolate cyclo-ligase [Sporocytophaga sp.]